MKHGPQSTDFSIDLKHPLFYLIEWVVRFVWGSIIGALQYGVIAVIVIFVFNVFTSGAAGGVFSLVPLIAAIGGVLTGFIQAGNTSPRRRGVYDRTPGPYP